MTGSKAFSPFLGKAPVAKTGKVKADTGFKTKEGGDTYKTLEELLAGLEDSPEYSAITDYGLALLTEDPLEKNLALADNLIADRTAARNKGLGRSLLSRGVGGSGFASSALLASDATTRSEVLRDALLRSSDEKARNGQTGLAALSGNLGTRSNFASLLGNYVASLLGQGLSGQAAAFGQKQNSLDNQSNNQFAVLLQAMKNNGNGAGAASAMGGG